MMSGSFQCKDGNPDNDLCEMNNQKSMIAEAKNKFISRNNLDMTSSQNSPLPVMTPDNKKDGYSISKFSSGQNKVVAEFNLTSENSKTSPRGKGGLKNDLLGPSKSPLLKNHSALKQAGDQILGTDKISKGKSGALTIPGKDGIRGKTGAG